MTNYKSIFGLSVLLLGFFLIYSDTILSLSLFGDATIHGSITKQILNHSISDSKFTYPPLYNILQGLLFLLFGEKGMNLIVLLGLILISISIFLLAKEITGKTFIGFLSIIIVLSSPKLIFYSSRMYMEILLSGFFIYSIYLLMRFVKTKSIKDLILLTFFIVITSSIKQQGLFILFPSILLFLFIFFLVERQRLREKKVILDSLKKVGIFLMIFIILISPIYLALFHSVGRIIPGNEDYKVIKITNQIGQKISGYEEPAENIIFNAKYGQRVQEIRNQTHHIGATQAESRHIYTLDMISSTNKFNSIHGLYIEKFRSSYTNEKLETIMKYLMFFGIILVLLNIIFKNNLLHFKDNYASISFIIFLLIFLFINYLLFERNNDQIRYHLFIAIIFSIFSAITLYFICYIIVNQKMNKCFKITCIFIIFILLSIQLFSVISYDSELNTWWSHSQIYRSSKGGTASIQEVGRWINNHTYEDDIIWQKCGNEMGYYSERKVTGNFYYYFLNQSELIEIFSDRGIKYIVIYNSQIVLDKQWDSFCLIPKSFVNNITDLYPVAYTSSYDDINVYSVEGVHYKNSDS